MSRKIMLSALTAAAFVLSVTGAFAAAFDWPRDIRDPDSLRYDMTLERTFEGTVVSKGHMIEGLMYFPLKTADRVMEVQLGPKNFVKSSGFKLKVGEMVTVVGSPAMLKEREVLLAREVRTMTAVFVVRDRNGEPMWDPNRPIQMDPEFNESELCEMIEG